MTDKHAKTILIVAIILHGIAWIYDYGNNSVVSAATILNGLSGIIMVVYWIQKQLRITQHFFELREMAFVFYEVLVTSTSAYILISANPVYFSCLLSLIMFFIHIAMLVLFLLFMLTFRMKKLF